MEELYTFFVTCSDNSESVSQEHGATLAEALERWAVNIRPDGFIESLTTDERHELAADFSTSCPTHFGIPNRIEDLDGVWRVSTALRSGKHLIVTCIRSAQTKQEAEQAGTGQPAIRPKSRSEGGDKPQPEAEWRSR